MLLQVAQLNVLHYQIYVEVILTPPDKIHETVDLCGNVNLRSRKGMPEESYIFLRQNG